MYTLLPNLTSRDNSVDPVSTVKVEEVHVTPVVENALRKGVGRATHGHGRRPRDTTHPGITDTN